MKIGIIAIGDELLNGQVVDTNSKVVGASIAGSSWTLTETDVIHDDPERILCSIERMMALNDVVITSGGLGPTRDDRTKQTLLQIFGGELVEHKESAHNIDNIFRRRGLTMNELTRRQAWVPSTCKVIVNRYGTAPVMWFEQDGKVLVALPGVPQEFKGCWQEEVYPALNERFMGDELSISSTLVVSGISESALAIRLGEFEDSLPANVHLAYLPKSPYIRLRLDGNYRKESEAEELHRMMLDRLKGEVREFLLSEKDESPAELLVRLLKERRATIATAESCTGGRIASALTAVAGASAIFKGGVVAYSNYVKSATLGVKDRTLREHGAVSLQTVEEMANGVARITGADYALATSGIAGPGGGTPDKPVGTVCIAVKTPEETLCELFHFTGNRESIMDRSVNTAIIKLCKLLKEING